MVLRTLHSEIDQVTGMSDHRIKLGAQGVIGKSLCLVIGKRLCKPLHVILHKDLHRRAPDANPAIDRSGRTADCRHMRPEQGKQIARDRGFFTGHVLAFYPSSIPNFHLRVPTDSQR